MARLYTFGKEEKLKSRKGIDALFRTGSRMSHPPLRIWYRFLPAGEEASPVQTGVGASKKGFKRAVDRNRIKRLLREAYRLQKAPFLQAVADGKMNCHLFIMYTGKELPQYTNLYTAINHCLEDLQTKIPQP